VTTFDDDNFYTKCDASIASPTYDPACQNFIGLDEQLASVCDERANCRAGTGSLSQQAAVSAADQASPPSTAFTLSSSQSENVVPSNAVTVSGDGWSCRPTTAADQVSIEVTDSKRPGSVFHTADTMSDGADIESCGETANSSSLNISVEDSVMKSTVEGAPVYGGDSPGACIQPVSCSEDNPPASATELNKPDKTSVGNYGDNLPACTNESYSVPVYTSGLYSDPVCTTGLHCTYSEPVCTTGLHCEYSEPVCTTGLHCEYSEPVCTTGIYSEYSKPACTSGLYSGSNPACTTALFSGHRYMEPTCTTDLYHCVASCVSCSTFERDILFPKSSDKFAGGTGETEVLMLQDVHPSSDLTNADYTTVVFDYNGRYLSYILCYF
jgi:hypothetical protein